MSAICGMIGAFAREAEAEVRMAAMMEVLVPRGPDGGAVHIDRSGGVAMGLRLLKARPDEPEARVVRLQGAGGVLIAVVDGQVFNLDEVAGWLNGRGVALTERSPAEVLARLYEQEGAAGLRRVDGQFGAAVWDGRKGRLVLLRDFLGVRPVYYFAGPRGVIFSSEIKALLQHPEVPAAVDTVGVSHYLTFLTVPGPRTLFDGIRKVPAGSAVSCAADGGVAPERFWDLLDSPVPERDDEAFYVERVRDLHQAAVARRRVDGPIGALLSGGNDSSANVSLLSRMGCAPLHTFTVGLRTVEGQRAYNDLYYAKKVADFAQSQHYECLLSVEEFLDLIPATIDAMDDLVSEPSSVFLYQALRLCREHKLRVVITGEANDELCCGHGEMIRIRNRYYQRWRRFMKLPGIVRQAAAAAAPIVSSGRRDILLRAAQGDEYFWNFEIGWMESEKPLVLSDDAWARVKHESPAEVVHGYAERVRQSEHGQRDYLNYMIYVMMQDYYFGNLMLGKLDLLSARLGIEARCPYTEPAYAHFVYNVPAGLKFRGDLVKYFFKKAIGGVLPDEIIYRPKQGFRTPVVELFAGALGEWARPILFEGGLTREGVLRRDHLLGLLHTHRTGQRDHSNRLWTAMVLNLWYDRWIRGRART